MKRSGGFSLLETLAALALLALLLLGVTSALRTTMKSTRANVVRTQRIDELRAAQDYLRHALSGAMAYPWRLGIYREPIVFRGSADAMTFVAPGPGYLEAQGLQVQRLRLAGDEGDRRLELAFASLAVRGHAPVAPSATETLVDHVVSGTFRYDGVDNEGKPLSSRDAWPYEDRMPTLVSIQLVLRGGVRWPVLSIPLRMDASAVNGREGLARLQAAASP